MIRCNVVDGVAWFPVIDLVDKCKDGEKVHKSAISWLKRNCCEKGLRLIKHNRKGTRRAGKLLSVNFINIRVVGMYEAHLQTGKDFRAKWSELPDTPNFPTDAKLEISWRNLYKWSKVEHIKNTGVCQKQLSFLRSMSLDLSHKEGYSGNHCESITFKEAKELLGR